MSLKKDEKPDRNTKTTRKSYLREGWKWKGRSWDGGAGCARTWNVQPDPGSAEPRAEARRGHAQKSESQSVIPVFGVVHFRTKMLNSEHAIADRAIRISQPGITGGHR